MALTLNKKHCGLWKLVSCFVSVNNLILKVPGPISHTGDLYSNDASSLKKSWFKFQLNRFNRLDTRRDDIILQLPISYCVSLIMVTITSHIFISIFQTVRFSAVKFTRDNEKNMSFLLMPKSLKVWKNIWSNQTGLL